MITFTIHLKYNKELWLLKFTIWFKINFILMVSDKFTTMAIGKL